MPLLEVTELTDEQIAAACQYVEEEPFSCPEAQEFYYASLTVACGGIAEAEAALDYVRADFYTAGGIRRA